MRSFLPFTSDTELHAIGRGLLDRTLPKSDWTHAAHFAVALWLLETGGGATLPALIRAYNESVGVANTDSSGYHETITQASLRAAHAFRTARIDLPLYRVCNELMESPFGHPGWLLAYWSRDVLFAPGARRIWVDPDISPLPFQS